MGVVFVAGGRVAIWLMHALIPSTHSDLPAYVGHPQCSSLTFLPACVCPPSLLPPLFPSPPTRRSVMVKFDYIEGMETVFVQVQGRDRGAVEAAGRSLGLEGSYIPHSYIELVQIGHLTEVRGEGCGGGGAKCACVWVDGGGGICPLPVHAAAAGAPAPRSPPTPHHPSLAAPLPLPAAPLFPTTRHLPPCRCCSRSRR